MKKVILLLLMATIMVFSYAIDDRIPRPIAHLKNIQPYNVDYQQDLVLLRNQNFIWIYSIFNPWSPRLEAVFTSSALIEDLNLLGDNQLYVCSEEPSNTISSVDTLSYPGKIFFTNPVIGNKIAREGSLLYVADRLRGIDIIDIGKGGMRELKSTFSEKWGIRDLLAEYPYIYALNDFGLVTIDISDLQFPISLGVNYEIADATVLAKNGNIIWIGAGKKLLAINTADMKHPRLINLMNLSNEIQDLEIYNDRLFVALGQGGVKIYGIKNPLKIEDLNTLYPAVAVYDIALGNDLIFLALGKDGWMIYEYR